MLLPHDPTILWFAGAAVVALLVALVLVLRARAAEARRRDRYRAPDVLDEGAAPAARNTALISAPSAAARVAGPIVAPPPEPLPRTLPRDVETAERAANLADTGPGIIGGIGSVIAAAAAFESEAAHAAAHEAGLPDTAEDDLTRLKGVGPKLRARLAELGVTRFAEIAAWSDGDIAAVDAQLGAFAGRATRDNWVAQARFLAVGDVAGYEAMFGKL